MKVFTIGGYGWEENAWIQALLSVSVTELWDIRQRAACRRKRFLNKTYLKLLLETHGIHYSHLKELAPSSKTRTIQKEHDRIHEQKKASRKCLCKEFIEAYLKEITIPINPTQNAIALFCVEKFPEQCHRHILAKKLSTNPNHLTP